MEIESMVHLEIEKLLNQMKDLNADSDEYKAIEDAALKLIDRANEMENLNIRIKENDLKEEQLKDDRKSKKWEPYLKIAGIAVPPTVALIAGCVYSVLERTEITGNPARKFLERALRL